MHEIRTIKNCPKCSKNQVTHFPCDRSTLCSTCGTSLCILCEMITFKDFKFCSPTCKNRLLTYYKYVL